MQKVTTEEVYKVVNDPQELRPPTIERVAEKLGVSISSVVHHLKKIEEGWKPGKSGNK